MFTDVELDVLTFGYFRTSNQTTVHAYLGTVDGANQISPWILLGVSVVLSPNFVPRGIHLHVFGKKLF